MRIAAKVPLKVQHDLFLVRKLNRMAKIRVSHLGVVDRVFFGRGHGGVDLEVAAAGAAEQRSARAGAAHVVVVAGRVVVGLGRQRRRFRVFVLFVFARRPQQRIA